jgi:peptidoglycan hydrolase CwlO-like protein
MGRVLIGALIAAIVAIAAGYVMSSRYNTARVAQERRVAVLQQQVAELQQENDKLTADLAKVQHEEERLAASNDELARKLGAARLSGKLPASPASRNALPYPPK